MFIYLIVNHVTGKYYVGQHKGNSLKKYLRQKIHHARRGESSGSILYNSMRKHDPSVWSIHALLSDIQTREELNQKEKDFIEFLRCRDHSYGYNICKGGEGRTGPLSPEENAKLRANNKAYWDSLGLVGQTFGRLTVLSEVPERSKDGKKKLWNCQCTCGNQSLVRTSALKSGGIRSCGCLISEAATKRVGGVDLVGMVFGRLIVEADAGRCKWSQKLWKCKCECGNSVVVRTAALKGKVNRTQSCGCLANSKNADVRAEAIRLRVEDGMRLTEIALQLNVPVPTCCGWLKPYPLTASS